MRGGSNVRGGNKVRGGSSNVRGDRTEGIVIYRRIRNGERIFIRLGLHGRREIARRGLKRIGNRRII